LPGNTSVKNRLWPSISCFTIASNQSASGPLLLQPTAPEAGLIFWCLMAFDARSSKEMDEDETV
jgi:hypothetical protein